MKAFTYTLLAFFLLSIASCGKIEINDGSDDKGTTKTDPEDTTSTPRADGLLTVAQALKADSGEYVKVLGYYVGYISNQKYYFNTIPNASNANLLLADKADETTSEKTFAVSLGSTDAYERMEWNLYDHPEYLQKRIVVEGYIEKYYRKNGIKTFVGDIYLYEGDDDPTSPTNPDDKGYTGDNGGDGDEGGDSGGDKGNGENNGGSTQPSDTTNTSTSTSHPPTLKDSTAVITGGR